MLQVDHALDTIAAMRNLLVNGLVKVRSGILVSDVHMFCLIVSSHLYGWFRHVTDLKRATHVQFRIFLVNLRKHTFA